MGFGGRASRVPGFSFTLPSATRDPTFLYIQSESHAAVRGAVFHRIANKMASVQNMFALLDDENEDPQTLAAKKPVAKAEPKVEAPKDNKKPGMKPRP